MARPAKSKTIRITVGEAKPTLEVRKLPGRQVAMTVGYPDFDVLFIFPDKGPAAEWLAEGVRAGVLMMPYLEGTESDIPELAEASEVDDAGT